MTDIPKRPDPDDYIDDPPITLGFHELRRARQDHEHAVAKVAVEALKDMPCPKSCGEKTKPFGEAVVCPACHALAKIEASGWKP